MGRNQHVVPYDGKWAVRAEGGSRVTSVHRKQGTAIDTATTIAKHQKSEVVIHRPDGTIRDKDSYGPDPCPPKDTRY